MVVKAAQLGRIEQDLGLGVAVLHSPGNGAHAIGGCGHLCRGACGSQLLNCGVPRPKGTDQGCDPLTRLPGVTGQCCVALAQRPDQRAVATRCLARQMRQGQIQRDVLDPDRSQRGQAQVGNLHQRPGFSTRWHPDQLDPGLRELSLRTQLRALGAQDLPTIGQAQGAGFVLQPGLGDAHHLPGLVRAQDQQALSLRVGELEALAQGIGGKGGKGVFVFQQGRLDPIVAEAARCTEDEAERFRLGFGPGRQLVFEASGEQGWSVAHGGSPLRCLLRARYSTPDRVSTTRPA